MQAAELADMVSRDAALRRRRRLQPVGGQGDKIFPPTYPGEGRNPAPRHVYERRRRPEGEVWCVLVDSVQSQANRLEEALLSAAKDGIAEIPYVRVDFRNRGIEGIEFVTSLDAPHRVYDAILRDSLLDGTPFMECATGRLLARGDPASILEISPNALLFGAWHSTGEGGGIGAKFARCLVSEIVAVDVPVDEVPNARTGEIDVRTAGRRTGSRMDPLGVLRKVEVYKGEKGWDVDAAGVGKKATKVRPSEINHGNIAPTVDPLGITCDHLEHTVVLSFAALRRLRFGSPAKDAAGRTLLAALGLLAIAEQDARGYALRSRCDLVCDGPSGLECVHPDGSTRAIEIDVNNARRLYAEAAAGARAAGFQLAPKPVDLLPQDKLVAIVRRSQDLALQGEGGEAEGTGA
ncbi:type I-G CRISPR-associated RAMP protein Csb1/Cas7g [Prosthecodimorpha staleyi]|uniref:Type I-U CRISPR-associated protein Cas7 n=1 Tax=Prosthecodimorpha staleyi TaxID=2840188 RepID=A0A947D4C2_9HYPH|nr:type I-U CRISPR-associated RAMP protein Csb1/Cas7u [Prosthecodimorpha staleyi]MBT9290788.1 type I-U CRISPR-associated protein Cas7 [Prosthecodimorpha staleyi]